MRPLSIKLPSGLFMAGFVLASLLAASGCSGGGGAVSTPVAMAPQSIVPAESGQSKTLSKSLQPAWNRTYQQVVAASHPLAYYPLNEISGKTMLDASGNEHNGTYVANVALNQAALRLGDPTAKSAGFAAGYGEETATWTNQAVSAECWIKPTAADIAGNPRFLENGWTDHSGNGFMLWISNGTLAFNTGWLGVVGTSPLVAGQIYHVVGTYDNASGATLYVNGFPVANAKATTNFPEPQTGDSKVTYIGVLDANPIFGFTGYFQGDISDCAVYDHAITMWHVARHYNVGAEADVKPTPMPVQTQSPTPPPPTPTPQPIVYNASTACIAGKQYTNNVLPTGEGEFASNGLDRKWWGRMRGNPLGGNHYSGFQVSWGRNQYDTYFGDVKDGISYPSDDPFYVGADTGAPGSPNGVRISAEPMPSHLVGNPQVNNASYYSGVLDTPIDQQYGFFVARVRLPAPNPGMSPAYWFLTNNGVPQGQHGPLNGEWDAQEMFGNDEGNGMNSGNIVWNSGSSAPQNWGGVFGWLPSEPTSPSQDYHDYGVLVSPGGEKISPNDYGPGGPGPAYGPWAHGTTNYLDGVPLYGHTGGADMTQGVAWKEMMAMFQVGPKGGWLGSPNPANFPASYWIQWMRVYQPTKTSCS
jgi:hypothetical protein